MSLVLLPILVGSTPIQLVITLNVIVNSASDCSWSNCADEVYETYNTYTENNIDFDSSDIVSDISFYGKPKDNKFYTKSGWSDSGLLARLYITGGLCT